MVLRIVIAGESQCTSFAEICLVADHLAQNLPNFCYEYIEKPIAEWKSWLLKINLRNKWNHQGSPLVWKELLTPGSKPLYIGGASEFLEYCHSYYKFDINLAPRRFDNIIENVSQFQKKIKQDNIMVTKTDFTGSLEIPEKNSISICLSGAGHPLSMFIISGLLEIKKDKKNVSKIYINDKRCSKALMEYVENECNYIGTDISTKIVKYVEKIGVGLTCSDILIILDHVAFRSSYTVGEWLDMNKKMMESIAIMINASASPTMYVLLANLGPACYNATVLRNLVTNVNKNNIVVATSDLGLEVAAVAAELAEIPLRNIFCPPVWGFVGINHLVDIRTTFHKYYSFDPYERYNKVRNSTLYIGTITPEMRTLEYLIFDDNALWKKVSSRRLQKKNAERQLAINKSISIVNVVKIWMFDPHPDYIINLGVLCNGSFGLTFEGVFSQPARLENGKWTPASNYLLPRDPYINISYLQYIAELVIKLEKYDLPQVIRYTPCICKRKKGRNVKRHVVW